MNAHIGRTVRASVSTDMDLIATTLSSLVSQQQQSQPQSAAKKELMQTHALLKLHVNRWRSCRKEWHKYTQHANARYKNSHDLLKSIFEDMQL